MKAPVKKILFICSGNICRSPSAEGVLRRLLHDAGLAGQVVVDSAGIEPYHVGEAPDHRAQQAALARHYDLSMLRARQIVKEDFEVFDFILAMDKSHLATLKRQCPPGKAHRLQLFMDYAPQRTEEEVPDPYYGSARNFDYVLDLIEAAARGLIDVLKSKTS